MAWRRRWLAAATLLRMGAEFSAGDNRHAPNAVGLYPTRRPGNRLDTGAGATPRDRRAYPLQPGRLVDVAATRSHQGAQAGGAQEGVRVELERRRHAVALEGGARPDRAGAAPLSQSRR